MIQPKYSIGQQVYAVHVSWLEERVQCPDCMGTKEWKVVLPSGEEFQHPCNTCRFGWQVTGFVSNYADRARISHLTIGSIQVDTASDEPVRYMCVETGIGTGTIHYEKTLHPNKESADVYAAAELERVKGLRQAEELKQRKHKKDEALIYGKRKPREDGGGKG